MDLSILICTRNRATALSETLASIQCQFLPRGFSAEVLVIDNGSTDSTADVIRDYARANLPVRHVFEPRPGKGYAYNRGIAESRATVLLWTDDDVRVPQDWAERVTEPIFTGQADAVAGGVRLAPHLERAWMTPLHKTYLAATDELDPQNPMCMVGANMAFSKDVTRKVPGFDTELGPGALGFCDETLYSFQLKEAGFRLTARLEAAVEHHFDPDRLLYRSMRDRMRKEGRSLAYIAYHWQHIDIANAGLNACKRTARLAVTRMRYGPLVSPREGMPEWEMRLARDIAFYRHYLTERKRPRNYERHGCVKRD